MSFYKQYPFVFVFIAVESFLTWAIKKWNMGIKKVWIEEGCISCGMCESICPEVFEMPDQAIVKEDIDPGANEAGIKEAAGSCPVEVIKYE